jgi:signal peptidase I
MPDELRRRLDTAMTTLLADGRRAAATVQRNPPRIRRLLAGGLTVGLILLVWLLLAPVQIGGGASYVVTDGISMLPHFRAEGLVITRSMSAYHVGEVAAYHNQQLHTVVMHRIVATQGNRYVFKGDNNDFIDTFHPTRAEIVGKEWIYIPSAWRILKFLRSPAAFALIMALLGMFAASAYVPRRSRRRRRHHA